MYVCICYNNLELDYSFVESFIYFNFINNLSIAGNLKRKIKSNFSNAIDH